MNKVLSADKVKWLGYALSISFLIIHLMMLNMFSHYGVVPMAWFNIFSIAFYIFSMILLKTNMTRTYIITVYLEVVLHMVLAIYFVGWNSGFQICLIGMSILAFYSEYIATTLRLRKINGLLLSLVGMVSYLVMCVIDHNHEPMYHFPDEVNHTLQLLWGFIVFSITISFLKLLVMMVNDKENYLTDLADNDELTGLNNRYAAREQIRRYIGRDQEHCWIAMMDIDDFKLINDNYGHNYGDYVLKTVASIMKEELKEETICRWGGEEFLIIGKNINSENEAYEKIEKVRKLIEEYNFSYEGTDIRLTITGGVALYQKGQSVEKWIETADQKLYEGKNSGKNRIIR